MATRQVLDFYLQPGTMTSLAEHDAVLGSLPVDVPALARYVQGLLLHEHLAPVYGQQPSDERRSATHLRRSSRMLDSALAVSDGPLESGPPLDKRIVCTSKKSDARRPGYH